LPNSQALVTPVLGIPTSGTLTNCTGLPAKGISWTWGEKLTVGDANPPVVAGYLYDCTDGTTITITDFFDSGNDDHSEFVTGDRIGVLMNDSDVTIGFDSATIEGNAETQFTGHPTTVLLIEFIYRDGVWYSPTLTSGLTNAVTMSAKIGRNHNTFTGNDTMTDDEAYNYTHYVTAAAVINLPAVGAYHEFSIKNHTDGDVNINPDNANYIKLNGAAAFHVGDSIVGTDIGDGCSCEYYAANTWACDCVGYEDAGD